MDLEKRIDAHDRQFARHEKKMDRIDKQIDATMKLVRAGMKLVIADQKQQKENWKQQKEYWRQQKEINATFDYKLNAVISALDRLVNAQKRTDAKFDRFIDELRRGNRNGHSS